MSEPIPCPKETPFFIVGNPRSGTTLLTFILSSHPRIHIPGETGFLPWLTKYAQIELSRGQVDEIIKTITRLNKVWKGLVEDEDEFYHALPSKSLECVLDALYIKRVRDFNAERWGDKTPSYVRFILQIDRIFPTAQFIHVIRDGRDSILSAQKKWGNQRWYMDNYYLLMNWRENVEAGRQAGKMLGPNRYKEIKYENLVQYPKEIIEKICLFLQEDFHPEMLAHSNLAKKVITPQGHTEVLNPINTQSVERWRREMAAFDLKLADRLIGDMLLNLGYSRSESDEFSPVEGMSLLWLGVRYNILKVVRKLLYRIGVLQLNRGKLG